MAKSGPKTAASIQKLLDERQQIQRWLDRLTMTADAAPENAQAGHFSKYPCWRARQIARPIVYGSPGHW